MKRLKTAMLSLALLGGSFAVGLTSEAQTVERDGEPDIIYSDHGDVQMNKAQAAARASLDHFWAIKDADPSNAEIHIIKVGLPTNSGTLEHIWVEDISRHGATYKGTLANEPYDLANGLGYGDKVKFTARQISDWAYSENGRMRGHFTTRVLVKSLPRDQAAQILASLHESPLP